MNKRTLILSCLLAGLHATAPVVTASIEASFESGNTDEAVDGYPGTAGEGWVGPWQTEDGAWGDFDEGFPSVQSENPLPGSDLYLDFRHTHVNEDRPTGGAMAAVGRQWGAANGVDPALPHRTSFEIRFDSDQIGGDTHMYIFDRADGFSDRYTGIGDITWLIRFRATPSADQFNLHFYDGNRIGENIGFGDSEGGTWQYFGQFDQPLDNVFHVTVDVFPETGSWSVTITDGDQSVSAAGLGFNSPAQSAGGYLHFGTRVGRYEQTNRFSLGSLAVDALPEAPRTAPAEPGRVVSRFEGGHTDTVVDAYPGQTGAGWMDRWYAIHDTSAEFEEGFPTVRSEDPLPGAEDYLDFRFARTRPFPGASLGSIGRQLDPETGIALEDPHRIGFDFRIDGDEVEEGTHIFIFDRAEGFSDRYTGIGDITWILRFRKVGDDVLLHFYDGNRTGANIGFGDGDGGTWQLQDFDVSTGTAYRMTIDVEPETGSWSASVTDGDQTASEEGLGFNSQALSAGGYLHFGTRVEIPAEPTRFSLGSLVVDQEVEMIAGFEEWRAEHFDSDELADDTISGPLADPIGDGVPNLVAFLLGGDPWVSSRNRLPVPVVEEHEIDGSAEAFLTVTFTRRAELADAGFEVEVAGELGAWSADAVLVVSDEDSQGNVTETWRDVVPVSEEARRFMRLAVFMEE